LSASETHQRRKQEASEGGASLRSTDATMMTRKGDYSISDNTWKSA